jgi:hypothetical protein
MGIGLQESSILSASKNKIHLAIQPSLLVWFFISLSSTTLTACMAPLAALGSSGTAAASSVGTTVASAAVANPVTATSIASSAVTGKSPLEHAASAATKKECSFINAFGSKPICEEIAMPQITDNSTLLLGPADTAKQ